MGLEMAGQERRRALLGRLADLGWFARRGEVAATQALAVLLEDTPLRIALLRRLEQMTGTDLGAVASFHAELVHEDLGRPDLEGHDSLGHPLVVVEAKFGAVLTLEQVSAYVADLGRRLADGSGGVLVLLVPSYRKPEAETVLEQATIPAAGGGSSSPSVTSVVLTWDEWLLEWDQTVSDLSAAERAVLECDLAQLRELCRAMVALDVPPLGLVAEGKGLQGRGSDLRRLVGEVTRRFRLESGQLLPLGTEPDSGFYRRYIPGGPADPDCYCAVGVIGQLADEGGSPFWLRYSRTTSSFRTVSERIMASRLAPEARGDGGHLWLPLRVSGDRSGATVIDELAARIEEIRSIAAGLSPSSG